MGDDTEGALCVPAIVKDLPLEIVTAGCRLSVLVVLPAPRRSPASPTRHPTRGNVLRRALEWPRKQRSLELAPLACARRARTILGINSLSVTAGASVEAGEPVSIPLGKNPVRQQCLETVPTKQCVAQSLREAARVARREPRVAGGCDPCRPSGGGSWIVICHSARNCASRRTPTGLGADAYRNKRSGAPSLLLSLPTGGHRAVTNLSDSSAGICCNVRDSVSVASAWRP